MCYSHACAHCLVVLFFFELSVVLCLSGLMVTSAMFYHVLHFLNITIDIRNVCVFLAPLFSSLTVIVTYHLTKELKVCMHVCRVRNK